MSSGVRGITKEWFGGLDMMDMGAALGGLAASTMIPGMIIKEATTPGQKLWKAVAAFACAVGAGFVFRNVSPSAGKYAIAGGVAGALAQTLGAFTNIKVGAPMRYLPAGRRSIGEVYSEPVSERGRIITNVT